MRVQDSSSTLLSLAVTGTNRDLQLQNSVDAKRMFAAENLCRL